MPFNGNVFRLNLFFVAIFAIFYYLCNHPNKSRLAGRALSIHRIKSDNKPRRSSRHLDRVGCTHTTTGVSCQPESKHCVHQYNDVREFTRFRRFAKVSAIDVGARVVHSRSGINSRGFCKANQSQSIKFSASTTFSLSISVSLSV
jgi:hypothetical protein